MMKKLIAYTVIALASATLHAQSPVGTFSIIPRVGASFSNITKESMGFSSGVLSTEALKYGKTRTGFMAGAALQYQAHRVVAVSLGIYYHQMGCTYDDTDLSQAGAGTYTVFAHGRTSLNYLSLPVMGHLYVARNFSFNVGIQPAFLLYNRVHSDNTTVTIGRDGSYTYTGPAEEIDQENKFVRKTDLSIPIGISYEYQNVVVDVRYNFGISKVYKSTLGFGSKNRSLVISAGYKFDVARL